LVLYWLYFLYGTGSIFCVDMIISDLPIADTVAAIEGAWFFGWAIGIILWAIRFFVIELPKTGSIFMKGGET